MSQFSKTRWILMLTVLLFGPLLQAKEQASLLISVPEQEESFVTKISTNFRARFEKLGFDVKIDPDADQHSLHEVLADPQVRVIFWISHGASLGKASPGIRTSTILDRNGIDLTPVLKQAHPVHKIISILSCDSAEILADRIKSDASELAAPSARSSSKQSRSQPRKQLRDPMKLVLGEDKILGSATSWILFESTVDLARGYLLAADQAEETLRRHSAPALAKASKAEHKATTQKIVFERIASDPCQQGAIFPALRLETPQGRILATVPKLLSGEKYRREIQIPQDLKRVTVQIGRPPKDQLLQLGVVRIYSKQAVLWEDLQKSPRSSGKCQENQNSTRKILIRSP